MKMLLVDDEEFELELMRSANTPIAQVVSVPALGRNGAKATPDSLRKLIASEALEGDATAAEIADAFNVSPSSVSAYRNGATSTTTYNKPAEGLGEFVDAKRQKIKGRAENKLLLALKHITEDKLKDAKVTELSTIAANMSRVVEKTSPKTESVINNNIIFYSPKQITKENYEVVEVTPDNLRSSSESAM